MKISTTVSLKALLVCLMLLGSSAYGQISYSVDFDFAPDGSVINGLDNPITNQWGSWGVRFSHEGSPSRELWTYDTSIDGGQDDDLETPGDPRSGDSGPGPLRDPGVGNFVEDWDPNSPTYKDYMFEYAKNPNVTSTNILGAKNVLIIQEDPNGDPDDFAGGGIINIEFRIPVTFEVIGILDLDESSNTTISFFQDTTLVGGAAQGIANLGNNSYQEIMYPNTSDYQNITKVAVNFSGSGAISGLKFTAPYVIPEPSTYALIFGGLALGVVLIKRRLSSKEKSSEEGTAA